MPWFDLAPIFFEDYGWGCAFRCTVSLMARMFWNPSPGVVNTSCTAISSEKEAGVAAQGMYPEGDRRSWSKWFFMASVDCKKVEVNHFIIGIVNLQCYTQIPWLFWLERLGCILRWWITRIEIASEFSAFCSVVTNPVTRWPLVWQGKCHHFREIQVSKLGW